MSAGKTILDDPSLQVKDRLGWEKWLERHHATASGVWLILARKGSGVSTPTYEEAVAAALCFGWIDGQKRSRDAKTSSQRFSPRGRRSLWSKINVGKAEALIAAGQMRPPGLAAIEAAKKDGRWAAAYASPSVVTVPADLQATLDATPDAKAFFASLSGANRYAVLFRVHTAKSPEGRRKKIDQLVAMLARGETIHPQRSREGTPEKLRTKVPASKTSKRSRAR